MTISVEEHVSTTTPLQYLAADTFAGRTVFVTGGGSGINLAIAKALARLGASIAICGRSEDRLQSARSELEAHDARVATYVADVRDYAAVQQAIDATAVDLGPIDVLICGAAGNFVAAGEDLSSNGFRAVLEIDTLGSFHAVRAAFDQLRRTRGNVLFISGCQSVAPYFGQAHIGAAKAGVDALMRSIAAEWGVYGIRANTIYPGVTEGTEGRYRVAPDETSLMAWTRSTALGRFADSEEIAAMAAVLCSPLAAYVTGAAVTVDGGLALSGPAEVNVALRQTTTS